MAEMLHYQPLSPEESKLYSRERRLFDLGHVDINRLSARLTETRANTDDFWQLIDTYEGQLPWPELTEEAKAREEKILKGGNIHPLEEQIVGSCLGTVNILAQTPERVLNHHKYLSYSQLSERRQLTPKEQVAFNQTKTNTDNLNMAAAEWTNQVLRSIVGLEKWPQTLEDYSGVFWGNLQKIGRLMMTPDEVKGLSRGILGPLGGARVLTHLGFEVYLPGPDQDAKEAIDLLIRRQWGKNTADRAILQIKSHADQKFRANVRRIDHERDLGMINNPEELREASQQNRLLHSAEKYGTIFGQPVIPLWMDVYGCLEGNNSTSLVFNRLKFPSDYHRGPFAVRLEEALKVKGGS